MKKKEQTRNKVEIGRQVCQEGCAAHTALRNQHLEKAAPLSLTLDVSAVVLRQPPSNRVQFLWNTSGQTKTEPKSERFRKQIAARQPYSP